MGQRSNQRGIGLIELMVALVITSVIVLFTYRTFFSSQREAFRVTSLVERRQNSRSAVQLLERDIRMAGSGWGTNRISGSFGGAQLDVYSLMWKYGGAASNDTIGIVGGWDVNTTLRAPGMATTGATIPVVDASGFKVGDLVVVTNGSAAHLFQATGVTTSPHAIEHATSSPYNQAGGWSGFPASGYGVGSQVYRVSWVSYKIDSTSFRRPSLVRWENGRSSQLVTFDVSQFKVNYLLQDGSTARDPGVFSVGIKIIDKVMPVVRTVATANQMASVADSFWTSVQPRTF